MEKLKHPYIEARLKIALTDWTCFVLLWMPVLIRPFCEVRIHETFVEDTALVIVTLLHHHEALVNCL